MAFPEGFVDEVRRAADIVRLISEHVSLRKMGTSWKGLCPFHREKSPSFNVRSDPPVFHCFGCGEGGDVFKFVMLHEKASFPEAVEIVARRFGVPVPERSASAGPERKEKEALIQAMAAAAEHFRATLWSAGGTKAREYLLGRGLRRETLERIGAGAAREGWSDLLEALRRRFPVPLLQKAGLVLEKQGGGSHYDRFRDRAVFPISDEAGRVVAFGARSLDGSEPKYLNSPETPIYQKGRVLYGFSWAREAARRQGRVVLMEGYLDVARALEAGVAEAVATCGTALTQSHARLLRRLDVRVLLGFDGDEAGRKATRKSLEILVEEGLKVFVVELPGDHDPDSYVKAEGAEAYLRRLDEALPYMDWLVERGAAENDLGTPAGKAAFLNGLLPVLARIDNAVERAAWVPRLAERGGLDSRAAREELRRAVAARASAVSAAPAEETPAAPARASLRLLPAEKLLLALLLSGSAEAARAVAGLADEDLAGLRSRDVLAEARRLVREGLGVDAARLASALQGEDARLVTELAVEAGWSDAAGAGEGSGGQVVSAADCVQELQRLPLRARMEKIQRDLAGATGERLEALLLEKLELGRRMARMASPS